MIALEMRVQLRRLMNKHQHQPTLCHVPLAPHTPHTMMLLGFASTTDTDADRVKFRSHAFTWDRRQLPLLLHKHNAAQPAGTIESLDYDTNGNLRIRARVDHPEARRCNAFSVGATVVAYEFRDEDNANFHAVIKQAVLTEVSLTETPSNPQALVQHRWQALPQHEHKIYSLMAAKVAVLQERLVPLLKDALVAQQPPPKPPTFRQLIAHMNRGA